MKGIAGLLAFIALAMLSWGVYGPILQSGQRGTFKILRTDALNETRFISIIRPARSHGGYPARNFNASMAARSPIKAGIGGIRPVAGTVCGLLE